MRCRFAVRYPAQGQELVVRDVGPVKEVPADLPIRGIAPKMRVMRALQHLRDLLDEGDLP